MILSHTRSLNQLFVLGVVLASAPLVIGMAWGFFYVQRIFENSETLVARGIELGRETEKLDGQIAELERNARQFAVLGDAAVRDLYAQRHRKLVATLDWLALLVTDDETQALVAELRQASEETLDRLQSNGARLDDEIVATNFSVLGELSSSLEARVNQELRVQLESLRTDTESARKVSYAVGAVSLLLMAIILGASAVMIARPLRQLDTHIRRLGQGDMDESVRIAGPQDVSRLGERLDWLRRRLAEVDQAKDQFMREMSHQLKTPLASIREGTELLLDGAVDSQSDVKKEVTEILHQNSLELQRMLDNLLSFRAWRTDPGQLTFEEFALRPLVEAHADRYRIPLLSRRQCVQVECPDDLIVNVDRAKFRVIIDNLLSNAIKHAPVGGHITVRVDAEQKRILLHVIDDGPGIAESERERVFELFYRGDRTDSRLSGTGVGLALVRAYVEAHGGTISVRSNHQQGGHFLAIFPRR